MKIITLLSAILLLSCNILIAQAKNEKRILAELDKQKAAWNSGNIEKYMETYWHNDSLMFIGKTGITYGWENTLKNYKRSYPDTASMGKLDFNILHVKQLATLYYHVTGKWHLTRSVGDLSGHFTLVFKKLNGKWVIISDHSS